MHPFLVKKERKRETDLQGLRAGREEGNKFTAKSLGFFKVFFFFFFSSLPRVFGRRRPNILDETHLSVAAVGQRRAERLRASR